MTVIQKRGSAPPNEPNLSWRHHDGGEFACCAVRHDRSYLYASHQARSADGR